MPANSTSDGPITNRSTFNTVHFDRNPSSADVKGGGGSLNDLKFGTFIGHLPVSDGMQAWQ